MTWATAWAPAPEELSACIECGLCLPHCPTFRLTGDEVASPRGRLNAMNAVARGDLPLDDAFSSAMSFCLQCRACEAACPSLAPFGRAMEGARAEIAATVATGRRDRLRRRILGSWLKSRRKVRIATLGAALAQRVGGRRWLPSAIRTPFSGLRRLSLRTPGTIGDEYAASGAEVGVVGLLAGCVMDPWFGDVHQAAIAVMRRAGYRVMVPAGQTCCGALAAHEGAADAAAEMAGRNCAAFAGVDLVVTDAAGCGAHMADYTSWCDGGEGVASRIRDVTEVVAAAIDDGRLPSLAPSGSRVAVQDPCHLRHARRVIEPPRVVLRAAGLEVEEIDPVGMCCGAAGVYGTRHPDAAAELGRQKAAQVSAVGTAMVASANPGCEMQLRAHLGAGYRIAHPVEFYAEALEARGV